MPHDKDFLISELIRFKKENGRIPTMEAMRKAKGYPPYANYRKEFGSWTAAVREAFNLPAKEPPTKDFLISELLRFKKEKGRIPRYEDMCSQKGYPPASQYVKMFGCWKTARYIAFSEMKPDRELNREYLIKEMLRFKEKYGRHPEKTEMCKQNGYPPYGTYVKEFGSWYNALYEILNVEPILVSEKKLLISEIRRFKEENGRLPKAKEMCVYNGYPNMLRYYEAFGSWNNAMNEAFPEEERNILDKKILTEKALEFERINGRVPDIHELVKYDGYISGSRYIAAFGSWANALKEIPFETKTDEDFFSPNKLNLKKLYIIGYIIGDGCVYGNSVHIGTTEKDKENLWDMNQYMKTCTKINVIKGAKKHYLTEYHIEKGCDQWVKDLALYGVVPQKSFTSHIPMEYLKTKEDEAAICRGLFDADGGISYYKVNSSGDYGTTFLMCGAKQLCEDYAFLLKKNCGVRYRLYQDKGRKIYNFHISGSQCRKICNFLYGHENFYIKRKKERFEMLLNGTFTKENDPYYN